MAHSVAQQHSPHRHRQQHKSQPAADGQPACFRGRCRSGSGRLSDRLQRHPADTACAGRGAGHLRMHGTLPPKFTCAWFGAAGGSSLIGLVSCLAAGREGSAVWCGGRARLGGWRIGGVREINQRQEVFHA